MSANANTSPTNSGVPSSNTDGKVKKSRNRVPTSCSVCRRRKMKCDRAKPYCGSCVANKTVNICVYNQQPWEYLSTEKQLSNEVLRLKLRVAELEKTLSQQQMISPPDSLSIARQNSNEEDDQLIDLGVRFDKLVIKQNRLVHYGTTSYMGLQANDPVLLDMYRKYFLLHLEKYYDSLKNKPTKPNNIVEEKRDENNDIICWTEKPNANKLIPTIGSNLRIENFTDAINILLPSHEIVWSLFKYFFEKGYPLFPYVDESIFKTEVEAVLFKGNSGEAFFKCTKSSQLTVVALLLILLRLSFLLLPFGDYFIDQDRITNMNTLKLCASEVSISPIFVELAKLCMTNAPGPENMLKKISLLNIQVLLFLKLYKLYAPEDADESTDSVITLAMVIQMCRIQGVYRDPELFLDVISDHKVRHLWRKIWYKLLLLDAYQAMQQGSPLITNDDQWDCKLPSLNDFDKSYVDNFSNPLNRKNNLLYDATKFDKLFGEQQVCIAFELEYKTTVLLRQVVQLSHNMKVMPKKSDFIKIVKLTEGPGELVLESFKDLMADPNNANDHIHVLNIRKFEMKCLVILVRYILSYILLISSGDEQDINDNFNNLYGADSDYLVKTTESSLKLFKAGFDFLVFETEDELSTSDLKKYSELKKFYSPYDKLLASAILLGSQRSMQFLNSITLRYGINFFSFTSLIKNFDNSQDSVDVLTWFNISVHNLTTNVDVSLDKKFSIMLYHYIKVFYTKCLLLKDKFFHCLRLNVLIKLFINHLRMHFPESYAELNEKYIFNKDENTEEGTLNQFENEDVVITLDNETEWLNNLQEDPRLSSNTLFDEQYMEIYSRENKGQSRMESFDNVFSPSFVLSNNIMSPMTQMNEMMPSYKQDNNEE